MPTPARYGEVFLANLGSFWSSVFAGQAEIGALTRSTLTAFAQTQLDLLELIASKSRFHVPIFKRKLWLPLFIQKSQVTDLGTRPVSYGDSTLTYGQVTLVYGDTQQARVWRVPLPEGVVTVGAVVDRPISPTLVMTPGTHYRVVPGALEFYTNPFESGLMTTVAGAAGSEERALTLWLLQADLDLHTVYEQFGYVLGVYFDPSSESYRDALNAFLDALTAGGTAQTLRTALASVCGIPLVREAVEAVEHLLSDADRLQVVTDRHVYTFPAGSTPSVAVGQTVYAGDLLTTALRVYTGRQALAASSDDLAGAWVGPEMVAFGAQGGLFFRNQELPTTYGTDANGIATLRFPLGGDPQDVEAFWAHVESVGAATGQTVARAVRLDGGTAEPLVTQVPATLNPMQFLVQARGDNFVVAVMKTSYLQLVGSEQLATIRGLMPGHAALLFSSEQEIGETYNGGDAIFASAAGLQCASASASITSTGINTPGVVPFYR